MDTATSSELITTSDIVMICAVLFAPFLAVFAQRQIDLWREKRGRKLWVFKTLMSTRAATLAPDHVKALNMIDLEFTGGNEGKVRDLWKQYLDQLGALTALNPDEQARRRPAWRDRVEELLTDLLYEVSRVCGYSFDKVTIKRGIYSPEGHVNVELENQAIRRLVLEILAGRRNFPTTTSLVPLNEEAATEGRRLIALLTEVLEGQRSLRFQTDGERANDRPGANC